MDLVLDLITTAAPRRLFFTAITAFSAILVGVFALLLRGRSLPQERWGDYFGIGFLIFGIQCTIPTMIGLAAHMPGVLEVATWLSHLERIVAALTSCANNLFFLAAARVLMGRKPHFPWWAIAWAGAAVVDSQDLFGGLSRLPDAFLSAYSLGILSWAMFLNLQPRRRSRLAALALLAGLAYGGLNIIYALHPLVTQGEWWPELKENLEQRLADVEANLELARAKEKGQLAAHAVDTSLFGMALFLKLFLAVGGLLLLIKSPQALSPRMIGETLEQVGQKDIEFFTGEGILRAVGQSLDSDRVALFFRLPGLSDSKIAWWEWVYDSSTGRREPRVMSLGELDSSPEGTVLASGMPIKQPRQPRDEPRALPRDLRSHIVVPIKHRGHVTACLRIGWRSAYAYTDTAVQQALSLAELLAPMIEERRQLAALDRWGRRVQNLPLGITLEEDTLLLARLVHDTLAPLAVGIVCHVGFQPAWAMISDQGSSSGLVDNVPVLEFVHRLRTLTAGGELSETPLEAKGIQIGTLLIVWPPPGGDRERPVVHSDSLHRKTLATLVVNSMFDAAHTGLGALLNQLQVRLGMRGVDTREEWQQAIEHAALESGLLWAVTLVGNRFLGSDIAVEALKVLLKHQRELGEQDILVRLHRVPLPKTGALRLLALWLPRSQGMLWLGVGCGAFGHEIEETWPWRGFLERLAETADLTLARVMAIESVQRLQREADYLKGLLTPATDPAIFLHDIRNLARNFQFAAQSLEEARQLKILTAPANVTRNISALHESAQRLYNMTDAIMTSKTADARKVYPLIEPIQELAMLLKPVLEQRHTKLEVSVSSDLVVVFPFHFAHQAILSLVSNSIDAVQMHGTIRIQTEDEGTCVRCHVIDNGPGIDPGLGDVFELGVSTKDGTGGKGLFLVRSLLQAYGGDVRLTESSPGRTVFTIVFPKDGHYEQEESPDHRG